MQPGPPTPDDASGGAATRPASLWPQSTRPAGLDDSFLDAASIDSAPPPADDRAAGALLELCAPLLALRVLLLVQLVLAIGVLVTGSGDWFARQAAAGYGGVAGSLLWLAAACASRRWLEARGRGLRALGLALLGAAAALLAWGALQWAGLVAVADGWRLAGIAALGAGLAGLVWAWLDLRARLRAPIDAGVRLAELQSRIRPHFLFNALNTAAALVRIDPARAEDVLEDLAALFRVALAESGAAVSLDEEIDLARRYLAIEQLRYGERLQVQWDVDERAAAARVPPLVLQPLVENAVRHGIEPAVAGGRIWVQAVTRRGQAVVLVSNTVPDEPSTPGHGIALHNVRERLRLLHDVAGECDAWREQGLFRVRIVVPL